MKNKIIYYKGNGDILNIIIHGANEGSDSEFIKFISKSLQSKCLPVLTFDFSYITANTAPSPDKSKELAELLNIVKIAKEQYNYSKFNLIGKSMGGVIALKVGSKSEKEIASVVILGFPIYLGTDVNIDLMKIDPFVPDENYLNDFSELIKNQSGEVLIVQGEKDLLGSVKDIKAIIKNSSKKIKLVTIPNATHGFTPLSKESTLEKNNEMIIKALIPGFLHTHFRPKSN